MALTPLGAALLLAQNQAAPPNVQQATFNQPSTPQPRATVDPTNVLGAYQLSGNMAEQQYQAQLQQQLGLWGGLAGIGSAGIVGASKIPAITNAISNWITPGSAPLSDSQLASGASGLGNWMGSTNFGPTLGGTGTAAAYTGPSADAIDAADDAADAAAYPSLSDASSLGGWMSNPSIASIGAPAATDTAFDTGASAIPYAAGSSIAADMGASGAADAAAAAAPAAADASGGVLAAILPFLFAA
jgi:hypothetical protein